MAEAAAPASLAERITDLVARKYATVATAVAAPRDPYPPVAAPIAALVRSCSHISTASQLPTPHIL